MLFFACSIVTLMVIVYALTPLFKEPKGNLEVELLAETELDRLLNRKAVVYTNIKDLELDYKMGRLSDADFSRLEAGYKNEAATILQKLDNLGAEKNVDESIEKDIADRRSKLPSSNSRTVKAATAVKTPPAPTKEARRCSSCGAELVPGKKFCADCGNKI